MPVPQNSTMTPYFQHIADITGIDFKSGTPEEISRAMSCIYIDGHSIMEEIGIPTISGVDDSNVRRVSELLDQALSAADTKYSFVSVMNHDDPYATPRMVSNDTLLDEQGRALDTGAMDPAQSAQIIAVSEQKKAAAKTYVDNFRANHSKNLAKLNQEIADGNANAGYHKVSNILSPAVYNPKNNTLIKNDILTGEHQDMASVMDMCNLVLLNRGYTMQELTSDGINIREGREKLGKDMEEILFSYALTPGERAEHFLSLADEAMQALEDAQLKRVDLSDDSTFDNVKYNRQIADMAAGMQKMVGYAQNALGDRRLDRSADRIRTITNYTDGIMKLDTARINATQPGADRSAVAEGMTAQVFIDTLGANYIKFRTNRVEGVKNEQSMTEALEHAIAPASGYRNSRTGAEYEKAYEQVALGNTDSYRTLVADSVKDNKDLAQAVQNTAKVRDGRYLVSSGAVKWFTPAEGLSFADYRQFLGKCIKGSTSQLDRSTTTGSLIAMYAAWDAEVNGREFSVDAYLKDTDMQREMGTKTLDFFEKHPIPADTAEATTENVRLFGQMAAAFNRRLDEVVVPGLNNSSPEKNKEQVDHLTALIGLFQDSEQLRALVPSNDPKLQEVFYEAEGGYDNYEKTSQRRDAAMGVMSAEKYYLEHATGLADKSVDHLMSAPKGFNMTSLASAVYLLNHDGKKFMGKKTAECTDDFGYLNYLRSSVETGFNRLFDPRKFVGNDRNKEKMLVDYVTSMGKNDKLDLNTAMRGFRKQYMELLDVQEENREDYQEEFEVINGGPDEAAFEEDPYLEINEIDNGEEHKWSDEMSVRDWKARIDLMDKMMADNDSAWIHSSPEYKAVREGLKEAKKAMEGEFDPYEFNVAMRKVFQNAGDYIEKKENSGKIGKKYGQKRLDAMRDLRGMMAKRHSHMMTDVGFALTFGSRGGEISVEKLENGFCRLASYLSKVEWLKKNEPEESKRMMDLLERVLEERGKNAETRKQLSRELDISNDSSLFHYGSRQDEETYTWSLVDAKEVIMRAVAGKTSMTEKAANLFGVLDIYERMAKESKYQAVREAGNSNRLREMAMCGRLGEKAMETRYKAMDFDAPEKLTKQEATELVSYATLGEFMRNGNSKIHKSVFKSIVNNHSDEKELMKSFENLEAVQILCDKKGKDNVRSVASGHAQEMLGVVGKMQLCNKLLNENKQLQKNLDKTMEHGRERSLSMPTKNPSKSMGMGKG